mmetsp:Transcript_16260/g.22001  ORF Transcript_16260/g.22001 Transcript_16260/m.22001 type:complete len:136 (+) Transcript_16260:1447-1854(+)|eukprot:CAMPEP_0185599714 /NCGR_PEP_ID=MMETSP0434-20130131/82889_1 /TAXON_ID=626734 ORGANISM="Favella taraikaensis, Strain Fe Narragansett Bay" /NCGR_SAMPLE_ID=MMETSP0434 /ASSEMBLY_ACC=CAM_ASM_000379 /LENGTH=135 /DNA_ID=CAMNT_0028229209 /DNA_START=1441 /DNA_END=1848 /DNA_ORIENTATION=+
MQTHTDFWGNTKYPNAGKENQEVGLSMPPEPLLEAEDLEDDEHWLTFRSEVQAELLFFSFQQEVLHEAKVGRNATKQQHISFLDEQIDTWIAIIVDASQVKLDAVEEKISELTEAGSSHLSSARSSSYLSSYGEL